MMLFYRKSILIFWILGINFLIIIAGCFPKHESSISEKNLKLLKGKYDISTLNYFYETVFHEDFNSEKRDNISKWNSNPTIEIVGSQSSEDIAYVKQAIEQVNKINLPIKLSLADTNDSASISVFFGDLKSVCNFLKLDSAFTNDIDNSNHFGLAKSINYDGVIEQAFIGIYFTEKELTHSTRFKVVLEEIVQSLGVVGDSYNYPSSLFFENYNPAKCLTTLDIDVLSLLYEPAISANYTRQLFETNFFDKLYTINTDQKIKNLLEKYPQVSLDDVEKCFTSGVLLKHPKEIQIYISGSIQKEDSLTIERAVLSLNKTSPNLNIKFAGLPDIEPAYGIVFVFQKLDKQNVSLRRTIETTTGKNCMFQKLIKSKIVISFNSNEKDEKLRQRSIIDGLYFSLMQIPQAQTRTNELFTIKKNGIDFSPRYANLFKLIYSDEFIDGFKLSDFKKINFSMDK
ncbi:DUF2927 domain-containing protein [Sphingobacterium sp. HJSM2_6]|uniref:DUF2927 domain-containing protein n=1 Tax=Sphingobacterium sp. HJSM2_6 TaxID=3366264 RepID=UPI003BE437F8